MTTLEITISAGAGSAAAALPAKVAETAAETTAVAGVQAAASVSLAEDKVADSVLGVYLNSDADVSLPNWAVLTALRAYGLNLKPQAEQPRPAPVRSQPVAVPVKVAVPVEVPAAPAKPAVKTKTIAPAATHVATKV